MYDIGIVCFLLLYLSNCKVYIYIYIYMYISRREILILVSCTCVFDLHSLSLLGFRFAVFENAILYSVWPYDYFLELLHQPKRIRLLWGRGVIPIQPPMADHRLRDD